MGPFLRGPSPRHGYLDSSPIICLDSGPMLRRREQNRNDQRARIVEAARRLFARRSVDEVTMSEVAADAGVARATVFNHFGSKHALMEAITEDVIAHCQGMLRKALADSNTSTPRVVATLFRPVVAACEEG